MLCPICGLPGDSLTLHGDVVEGVSRYMCDRAGCMVSFWVTMGNMTTVHYKPVAATPIRRRRQWQVSEVLAVVLVLASVAVLMDIATQMRLQAVGWVVVLALLMMWLIAVIGEDGAARP